MRFSTQVSATTFLAASSALSMAIQLQPRAVTADDIVGYINQITTMSQDLQTVTSSIPADSTVDQSQYQDLIKGFKGIVDTMASDITIMNQSPTSPFTDAGVAQSICDAFSNSVQVQQQLLNIVISKAGVLQSLGGGPVESVLKSLEGHGDTLYYGIIDLVPSCASDASNNLDNLDSTLKQAICAYTVLGYLGVPTLC